MSDFNFTTDYSNNNGGNSVLPAGEYECVINSVAEQATKSGAESIHFDLIVRNDLDQAMPETNGKHHNQHVWLDEWKRRKTNQYDMGNIQYFVEAAGIPEGTQITSIEQFCQLMYHKPVKIKLSVDESEYQGKKQERNSAAPWDWKKTQFPQVAHQWKKSKSNDDDPFKEQNNGPTVSNEDLPF